jgi:imidazoleglycerol-phosphate dehydratase
VSIIEVINMIDRTASSKRETKETSIRLSLNIDGKSKFQIATGIRFFDHMLSQLAQHGIFDLTLSASGSDQHHVVEDVAITLGKAFNEALGDKHGIVRMSHAIVPMDDALAVVSIDISGRGFSIFEASFDNLKIEDMSAELINHFFASFSSEAKINIQAKVLRGMNDHHKAEALFKALARALDMATRIDERIIDRIPSSKDAIED